VGRLDSVLDTVMNTTTTVSKEPSFCTHCGWDIDPETCWCGDGRVGHPYEAGHTFVPMGCTCGFVDAVERKNPERRA